MSSDDEGRSGFGRYTLLGEIGAGGMATVHLARLHGPYGFSKTVAVKTLRSGLGADKAGATMLVDEARLGARIHHPNVVATLDVIVRDDQAMLVLDYVHGEALSKLVAMTAEAGDLVPIPIAAAIVADALAGLEAAHQTTDEAGHPLEIIHRDLSPQNILVGVDGLARVADFGVAKAHGRLLETESGFVKGKAAYMAPEQARGEATQRSDVFSIAVVAWELLSGRRLFAGATHAESIALAMSAKAPPLRSERPEIGETLERVVLTGLRRDPGKRWSSARAMADAWSAATPVASRAEVGAWVRKLAARSLSAREALLSSKVAARAEDIAAGELLSVTLPTTTQGARRTRRLALFALAGAALGATAVIAFASTHTTRTTNAPSADAASADDVATPTPVVVVVAPDASATATTAATPPADPPTSATTANQSPPKRPGAGRTLRKAKDCDPPYYVDANGRTQYKKDCLR